MAEAEQQEVQAIEQAAVTPQNEKESKHEGSTVDPMEHIHDKVLFGLAKDGHWKAYPYDGEGHAIAGYQPATVGPFKIEFTKHMAGITISAAIVFALLMVLARRALAGLHANKAPSGAAANAMEAIVLFVRDDMVEPVGGHHLGHYTPIFITYFLLILICNLIGLIPEVGTATGNFGVTLGLGISVYGLIWVLGMLNQGPLSFIIHLVPPGTPLLLWPLMFVLELAGPVIKCFVLAVRLFANMIAGHLIVGSVLGLGIIGGAIPTATALMMLGVGVPLSLGISILEVLVCFIQAFVFTQLAVMFIGAAVHPEH